MSYILRIRRAVARLTFVALLAALLPGPVAAATRPATDDVLTRHVTFQFQAQSVKSVLATIEGQAHIRFL